MADDERVASGDEHDAIRLTHEAHRTIGVQIEELASSPDMETTARRLASFAEVLEAHFADEEAPDGLFDVLRFKRPEMHRRLKFLQEDHRRMMQALEVLRAAAGDDGWSFSRMQREVASFLYQLRRHERAEGRLIADVYYLDEGGTG